MKQCPLRRPPHTSSIRAVPIPKALVRDGEDGARRAGVRLVVMQAQAESEFDTAFASLVQQRANALAVGKGGFFNNPRERLVALAARHKMPAIYEFREFVLAGGLMSYGTHLGEMYRQIAVYTGRILMGGQAGRAAGAAADAFRAGHQPEDRQGAGP